MLRRTSSLLGPFMRLGLWLLAAGISSCVSTADRDWNRIESTTWYLVELDGAAPLVGTEVSLRLEGGERLFGKGGVNSYFGSFRRDGARFHSYGIASTRKAGPADARAQEERFLELLEQVNGVRLKGREELEFSRDARVILRLASRD